MTREEFRARLAALGLKLDDAAFEAAFKGAQHLRAEIARIDVYLATKT
ncbi:hypothetical protein [Limimaricola sp.]|nr:hypothetical protein [Limimaricola sp.]